tara:strand:- start:377 stop:529 length:153 start_codon:yes stop_codon:yes gene_type:complete
VICLIASHLVLLLVGVNVHSFFFVGVKLPFELRASMPWPYTNFANKKGGL